MHVRAQAHTHCAMPPPLRFECAVCAESRPARARVDCPSCEFAACSQCTRRFLLTSEREPACMRCAAAWSRIVLARRLPSSFLEGPLRRRREERLLARERARLPAAQPAAARVLRVRKAVAESAALRAERDRLLASPSTPTEALVAIDRALWAHERVLRGEAPDEKPATASEAGAAAAIGLPCPDDGCRGRVGADARCTLCAAPICARCAEPLGEAHACSSSALASVERIRAECRACPACRAPIFREDGCAQMWCTACRTAFHWQTGELLDEARVHNPHLAEWRRAVAGAAEGTELPDVHALLDAALVAAPSASAANAVPRLLEWYVELERARARLGRLVRLELAARGGNADLDLRVRHLLGELDEPEWMRLLQRRDKRREKAEAERALLSALVTDAAMQLRGFLAEPAASLDALHAGLEGTWARAVAQAAEVGRLFRSAPPLRAVVPTLVD